MTSLLHSGVWLIGGLGIAFAVYGEMFHECVKYKDEVPEVTGALKVCVKGWEGETYCKFYNDNCPEIQECINNVAPIPRNNHCMVCPETGCIYHGNDIPSGEMFDSVDGINKCQCFRNGKYKCETKELGQPISFCT
ncbi:uncharacterized protein LOC110453487 [Mizuhopecten yessoensis]|nr:uncharacterized protein LOC110453487 [Mizuhopecten yessoensis]XP_021358117.1 uncharacterized protein LOC110453487 [Mizuhopecten yessoensis]XP_021358118.1 uncharacterized protein LOC110453487 [Mizuhopecten yessoensis]XP_021358119.1 uncharacterized protein LOC110453487 [Mizuhopecten yessoensis]